MFRPKQVQEQLGVSSATLRLWSNHFEEHLSPSARSSLTDKGTPTQRRYVDADVHLFARAKTLLDRGLTYDQVKEALAGDLEAIPESPTLALAKAPERANPDLIGANGPLSVTVDVGDLEPLLRRNNELQEEILELLREQGQRSLASVPTVWERLRALVRP